MIQQLEARFGERSFAIGTFSSGAAMNALTNPETGSWTIVYRLATGASCIIAAGSDLHLYPPSPVKPKVANP